MAGAPLTGDATAIAIGDTITVRVVSLFRTGVQRRRPNGTHTLTKARGRVVGSRDTRPLPCSAPTDAITAGMFPADALLSYFADAKAIDSVICDSVAIIVQIGAAVARLSTDGSNALRSNASDAGAQPAPADTDRGRGTACGFGSLDTLEWDKALLRNIPKPGYDSRVLCRF